MTYATLSINCACSSPLELDTSIQCIQQSLQKRGEGKISHVSIYQGRAYVGVDATDRVSKHGIQCSSPSQSETEQVCQGKD